MEPIELHDIGTKVFDAFKGLWIFSGSQLLSNHGHRLFDEEQRFKLWAHSLGLNQLGHASLDYRVRDATFVKERLAQLLSSLEEHLENITDIVAGRRLPIEECEVIEENIGKDSTDEEFENEGSTRSDDESRASGESCATSFHEVDFRLDELKENIDLLYNLAAQIRHPRNRPQRPIDQLYKHIPDVPAGRRDKYIMYSEIFETAVIARVQQEQIIEKFGQADNQQLGPAELTEQYATTSHWLIHRAGIANARRKQQFIYWKEHALRLSRASTQRKPATITIKRPGTTENAMTSTIANTLTPNIAVEQVNLADAPSLTTSATYLKASAINSSDSDSVFSRQSRVSTAINLEGEKLEWPPPPTHILMRGDYFTCPYCKVLCPRRYLSKDYWQVHLTHDLQPYHCTYEYCPDPNQLYGTRQDWVNHENQHCQVWHCQEHEEELEFETQAGYVEHLQTSHPDAPRERYTEELIRTAVAPSLKLRRECPFCPFQPDISLDETKDMQKHVIFHLERLALVALPLVDDDSDGSDRPPESHEVQRFGRKGSIAADFSEADRMSFADFLYSDETQSGGHAVPYDTIKKIFSAGDISRVEPWLLEDENFLTNLPSEEVIPLEEFPIEYKGVSGMAKSREKRFGLDDPERVRKVYDRGEGDYYRVNSRAIQQYSTYAPLAGDAYALLRTIAQELDASKVICALDPNKDYLPRRRLPEILTVQRVRTIVSLPWFQEYPDKNKLTRDICLGPHPCLKLLAVLIGIGKAQDLPKHMGDELNDTCLPMDIETSKLKRMFCQRHQKRHSIINQYPRPSDRLEFSRWCYSLAAPYIRCDKGKHSHYILQEGDVFPIELEVGGKIIEPQVAETHFEGPISNIPKYGGYSTVYQVKIDGSHYDFGAVGLRHPKGFFALKKLTSHDREYFNLELASLLFSIDNAHSQEASMHLIQPLATFEVLDLTARATIYYFLFDWAEGNLIDFWRTNQNLVGDMRHSLWMSQQLHEICSALRCVHNECQVTLDSTDASKLVEDLAGRHGDIKPNKIMWFKERPSSDLIAKGQAGKSSTIDELYWRHGDIKPDNILWFHLERLSSDLLALSDFGSARPETEMSQSDQGLKTLAQIATYAAPEFDLTVGIISRASDIFSLGCVFLEYVTWFLLGFDSVESQFPSQRSEMDIYGFECDKFFAIQSDEQGGQQPFLKHQVKDWISMLQQHENCSMYIYTLLEIIRDKMLEPDREKRIHILLLIKEMQKLRQACENNDSFYLKTRKEVSMDGKLFP